MIIKNKSFTISFYTNVFFKFGAIIDCNNAKFVDKQV